MNYNFTENFDKTFQQKYMMGPNAMRVAEELSSYLEINEGMRILDLGCGMGLSSVLLAKKYNTSTFAADLWISPTDNHRRFQELNLDNLIVPISVDAAQGLPFAEEYFDILVTIDSYHYFGNNEQMLPTLLQYVKKGGHIAMAVPGLKYDFQGDIPEEMSPFWQDDMNFYTCDWWKKLWNQESGVEIEVCREMDCCEKAWEEWLLCDNPYAKNDINMMKVEKGQYFNLVQLIARKL